MWFTGPQVLVSKLKNCYNHFFKESIFIYNELFPSNIWINIIIRKLFIDLGFVTQFHHIG